MNTGIQDAINLAWKLALVAQGCAPARLLESYQAERAEVGKRLLQADALLTSLASAHHPLATASRDRVASCLMQLPRLRQFIAREMAGLRISYHRGPLVCDYRGKNVPSVASAVQVGDRAQIGRASCR